jgi:bacterioferritin-associated ferredoxin
MSEGATDLVKYIRWSELLRRVFGIEVVCGKCQNPLRLIALIKTEETAKKILAAMHLPTEVPQLHPARPPPTREAPSDEDWVN